ncbi:MAG TPA: class I SAM-dependent methyltransferase [Actinomycetota bacterium]
MSDYEPSTYGDAIADVYDELHEWHLDTDAAIEALARLAGEGPVLELGVGTGRIAVPLAERGIEVHGIDASESMVEEMRRKPGGEGVRVAIGDFAAVEAPADAYSLVFVVFNTLFALSSQEDQVRCFARVAERLTEDGVFVVEAFVPDVSRFDRGQRVDVSRVETDRVVLDVSMHDPIAQRIVSQHLLLGEGTVRQVPVELRYAWPSELDLMARLAGLRLRSRHGGWREEPFTATGTRHVSIYARA